ncbi:monoamine oxidase [Enterococcus florum]|uniref:Monoamine oxidase n=1 Tax=Enterococcus florum TaxID=2480627 RepID=A0A4P5P8D1_9ENTE|nr:NAD(P)/FAD-dependent oxidoreductase [Enterococcus florum]GCF94090.1 monoamine oxidase [Enterococcus florum]
MDKKLDVVVVGAGLAGLSAGRNLRTAGKTYAILEAHDRPGGKVFSEKIEGRTFEHGPQFVNRDMTEIVALAHETDQSLTRTTLAENAVFIDENRRVIDPLLAEIEERLTAAEIPENQSVKEFTRTQLKDPYLEKVANSLFSEEITNDSNEVSLAYLLEMSERYLSNKPENGFQVAGQLSNITDFLAELSGERVHYGDPVKQISGTEGDYTVQTEEAVYHTKAVIVAVPPTAAKRITYSDSLHEHFGEALSSFTDGAVIKYTWIYQEPFWHETETENGFKAVGGVVSVNQPGAAIADSSTEQDTESRLTTFIGGKTAKQYAEKSPEERFEIVLDSLVNAFGEPAKEYVTVKEAVWVNEPYYSGGYSDALRKDGLKDAAKILRNPYQGMVFAGTELAIGYPGFMEGAVRSGKAAVQELLGS